MRMLILFVIISLFSTSFLFAQVFPDADIEFSKEKQYQEERRQKEQREEQITPTPDIFTPRESLSEKIEKLNTAENFRFPEETPCFVIREMVWEGSAALLKGDLLVWIERQTIGQCVGAIGLQMLQSSFLQILMEEGFVTSRVVIPEQNLTTGQLQLQVITGTISGITDAGKKIGTHKAVLPRRKNKTLNQRDLDQGLENIRRLKSQQKTTLDLVPGEALGQTEIVIHHPDEKHWNGLITLDDSGLGSTGKYQLGGTLTLDSPFYAYDALSFSINHDANFANPFGSGGKSLTYTIPWGYLLFNASFYQSNYKQTVSGFSGDIIYRGESQGASFGGSYLLYRTSRVKGSIPLKISHQKSRSFINDVQVGVQYNNTTDYEIGFKHHQLIGPATMEV
ncbi:MAG: ShlB/FhaC/HecB family hemolysin secretion/activation protein, partial [Nitrospirota bacterium]